MVEIAFGVFTAFILLAFLLIPNKKIEECPNCKIPLEKMESYGFWMCPTCGHSENENA